MSSGSEAAASKRVAAEGDADRLSALPDGPLQMVLSFLPSREAVRTSLLARRWRHQWKSVPAVRITDFRRYQSADHLVSFVNDFLHFRTPSPISEMEINSHYGDDNGAAFPYMEQWVRYGLLNMARLLRVGSNGGIRWTLPDGLLISAHLIQLELFHLKLEVTCLDFSSCPALEELRIQYCGIESLKIMSPSVRSLSITYCDFDDCDRTQISFPCVTSFILADCFWRTPVLESMPLLASAFVRLQTCVDCCDSKYETSGCPNVNCHGCAASYTGNNTCVLEGLSAATSLELTSAQEEFLFRDDLTRCPVFPNLKTLLLNEWCMTPNLHALHCFLQHAPILQKLTLQSPSLKVDLVDNGADYDMVREPPALKHLTVEVKCDEVDEDITRILELLECSGVEKIKIIPAPKIIELADMNNDPWPSASFSFEQEGIA